MAEQSIEIVKQEASKIMNWANGLVVSNAEEYRLALEKVKEIKAARNRWISCWADLKAKTYSAWKEVVGNEKAGTDILDKAEEIAKQKADTWLQEEEGKAQEEQRRLQAIADENARKERERLEKQASKLKTPELKEERMAQAEMVEAPVIKVETPQAVEGASVRKTWKARLVDMDALIASATPGSVAASLLQFNERAANSFASSTKGNVKINGVECYEQRTTSVKEG
jgi:hypothetical protein